MRWWCSAGGIAGIGGTGISVGPVTGFGSVIVNGVEYDTSLAEFRVEDSATGIDQSDLAVGMVVTVTHDDSDIAKSISYKDNAEGPVSNLAASTFDVLGVSVTVDALTVYDGLGDVNTDGAVDINDLANDDIVEVSGHITGVNAVEATRVEKKGACPLGVGEEIEVKATISTIIDANNFTLGTLTVTYANGVAPSGLVAGDYVEVKSDACPASGVLTATEISLEDEGPDLSDLDEGEDEMEIKGVVVDAGGSAPNCTFSVNGQAVRTDSGTVIESNQSCASLVDGTTVEVQGQLVAGVLVANEISNEDSDETVDSELRGEVTVDSSSSAFVGTITVVDQTLGAVSGITVDITTRFEGELQSFDLDTIAASATPVCAEVKLDSANKALLIHEEDCN